MFKEETKAFVVLVLQAVATMLVGLFPYFEHGFYDMNPLPLVLHKSVGFILCVLSTILLFSSVMAMRSSFEVTAKPKSQGKLIKKWPFSITRNPIYLAALPLGFGWAFSFKSYGSFVMTIILYFILLVKIKYEEKFLLQKFGLSYEKYKKEVPKIFPKKLR